MTTTVKFNFSDTVQHAHPELETEIEYIGVANVIGASVLIKCLTATQHLLIKGANKSHISPQCAELAIPESLEDQTWSKGAMGRLLGRCRFAAMQEIGKQKKAALQAEISEDLKSNHHHNADFWPKKNVYQTSLEDAANDNGGGGKSSEQ